MTAAAYMQLEGGDEVVEIGCGTGLNFGLLQQAIGSQGKIIGVDLADRMLARARKRVVREGWHNVNLVQADGATYDFPTGADGIIPTFGPTFIPEFDRVIQRRLAALSPGGRWVVANFKLPEGWTAFLTPLFLPLVRPLPTLGSEKRQSLAGLPRIVHSALRARLHDPTTPR